MTCAMKLDYSEEENLTHSTVPKTKVKTPVVGFGIQWVTIRSLVPCYTLHVSQHVAGSLSEMLNQKMVSSAPSTETVFAYQD